MITKKIQFILFLISIFFLNLSHVYSLETKIILKINDEIITNTDLEMEYRYLLILNKNLRDIDEKTAFKIAKESLIKEIIKKKELTNYLNLKEVDDTSVNQLIKELYNKLDINSENDFKIYLRKAELDFDELYLKFKIEVFWNQLIYSKYSDQVNIDEDLIKKKILNNKQQQEFFNLSEIVYEFNNKEEINKKYLEILKAIEDKGFEKTVTLFSTAKSKNNSGSIGWIRKSSLSPKIINIIETLKVDEISGPIVIPTGALILKINEKKKKDKEINLEMELDKEITRKLNEELNNYSSIYFNKIKKRFIINEY